MVCCKFEECVSNTQNDGSDKCRKCRRECRDYNITCQENGKRYNLINDKSYIVKDFLVDGGIYYKENLNKCDRIYIVDDYYNPTVIFIELKGKNNCHAIEQLYETVSRHKSIIRGKRVFFRIVCSGAPNIGNDPGVKRKKAIMLKEFGSIPVIREKNLEEKYSNLN